MESTCLSGCAADTCTCAACSNGGSGDFARVRYFFGQRLTALDLADEQAYLVGKQRLHQRQLHGWGVVCGLTAERAQPVQGSVDDSSRVLRVRAGSAIDCHGRDVLLPDDHCLDVSAWYAKRRARLPTEWRAAGTQTAWLAVRYRDCPSDPVIAPRDPCGCSSDGCEYARVREGFELQLLTNLDDVCTEAADAADAAGALTALTGARTLACPACCTGDCSGWLVLARFTVTIADPDADGPASLTVTTISAPVMTIAERRALLPTWALQALVAATVARAPEQFAPAPQLGALAGTGTLAAAKLLLPVAMVMDGPGGSGVPIAPATVPAGLASVSTLDASGWVILPTTTAWDALAAQAVVSVTAALTAGTIYRLIVTQDVNKPVADEQLRALTPNSRALRFRAAEAAGVLTVIPL